MSGRRRRVAIPIAVDGAVAVVHADRTPEPRELVAMRDVAQVVTDLLRASFGPPWRPGGCRCGGRGLCCACGAVAALRSKAGRP